MIKAGYFKLLTSLMVATFLASLFSIAAIKIDFDNNQLAKYSKSDQAITKATIAWPRLISKPNQISAFNQKLSDWQIDSNFLIFRPMSDPTGESFILIGAKNYQDYASKGIANTPTSCTATLCDVIALFPDEPKKLDLLGMGLNLVDNQSLKKSIPIPADFGVDKKLPILITPMVEELAKLQTLRYLPASYGWQVSPEGGKQISAKSFKQEITKLESSLESSFENVAVNYKANQIGKLIANQDRISLLVIDAIKALSLIFIFLLTHLFFLKKRWDQINRLVVIALAIIGIVVVAALWSFASLLQLLIFGSLFAAVLYILNKYLDNYFKVNDLSTLSLYRSSLKSLLSIAVIIGLFFSVLISSFQYLTRIQDHRMMMINQITPFDITLKIGPSLKRPLDIGSLDEIALLAPALTTYPVIRDSAELITSSGDKKRLQLVAVGGKEVWQEDGLTLPKGEEISIKTSGIAPEIDLIIWLRSQTGAHFSIPTTGSTLRTASLPKDDDLKIVAFKLSENPLNAARRAHALGESTGRAFDLLAGEAQIQSITVDNQVVEIGSNWPIKEFRYALLDGPITIRPAISPAPVRFLYSPDIKADDLNLKIKGQIVKQEINKDKTLYQVADAPFVQVELADYQSLVAQSEPYATDPLEIWIKSNNPKLLKKEILASKFNQLKILDRADLIKAQQSSSYWQSWQKIFFLTLLFISGLIFLALLILFIGWSRDKKRKSYQMQRYFLSSAPSGKPLLITISFGLLSAPIILLLSRVLAGLLT